MYSGFLLFALGTALLLCSWYGLLGALLLIFIVGPAGGVGGARFAR